MEDRAGINQFLAEVNDEIKLAYEQHDYEKAVCCAKFLCSFYYEYDYKQQDDQMEFYARACALECTGELRLENTDKKKVFFYDRFALNSRGLANIYVKALLALGYEVVWCLFEAGAETEQILQRYSDEKKLHFVLIPRLAVIERMHALKELILRERAHHFFIYTTPYDVECIGVFGVLGGDVRRYLINLTDHTFWLGRCALDRCIEFRNFGANLSVKYRKIRKDQIVMLPYYPERRQQEPFQGLPFPEGEKFVFSGGSAYKIEGSDRFEQIVSRLLERHPDLKFIFATRDQSEKLDALASRYKNRFFVIQERMDVEALLRRAAFFLSTYPIPGGLMIQYALMNQCVPLCLADKNNFCSDPASYLLEPEKIDFVFYEPEALLEKAELLLSGCEGQKDIYEHFVIAEKDFVRNLGYVLEAKSTDYDFFEEEIDLSVFHSYYENRLTPDNFRESLRQSNNKWLAEKYPELFNGSSGV